MYWRAGSECGYNLMEDTQRQPRNTVSSVGNASVCLCVTLICIRNQMKDWKAAYRSQKLLPYRSLCCLSVGCSHSVTRFCLRFAGEAENTSCGAVVKLFASNLHCITLHTDSAPARRSSIQTLSSGL